MITLWDHGCSLSSSNPEQSCLLALKAEDGVYLLVPFSLSGSTKRDWAISSAGIWTEKMGEWSHPIYKQQWQ